MYRPLVIVMSQLCGKWNYLGHTLSCHMLH